MTTQQYAAHEIAKIIGDNSNIEKINQWIARGDGVAVYRNEDMGSRDLGHEQFVSFGSPAAMIEVDEPPVQLPDIGRAINWRYQLAGTYRGALIPHLPSPDEVSWATPYEVCDRIMSSFRDGPFTSRLSRWGMEAIRVRSGNEFTNALRLVVTIVLANPKVEVSLRLWIEDEGVNCLAPVDWSITEENERTLTGGDPNLGGAVVSTYNTTLTLEG